MDSFLVVSLIISIILLITFIAIFILYFKKSEIIITKEFKDILNLMNNTNEHIFLTGKAGTGKSELIKYFRNNTKKKYVILAPTGIAAIKVGGQTIHSFFKFPPTSIKGENIHVDYINNALYNNLDIIIIDEISMVRSDIIFGINLFLQKNLNNTLPFGGKQLVFIGDLFQLPPILKDEDYEYIIGTFGGQYFFDAPIIKEIKLNFKELTFIFRQGKDQIKFKNLLNNIRINKCNHSDFVLINSRHKANVGIQNKSIFLTANKITAKNINNEKLEKLNGELKEYIAEFSGKIKDKILNLNNTQPPSEDEIDKLLPAPYKLKL